MEACSRIRPLDLKALSLSSQLLHRCRFRPGWKPTRQAANEAAVKQAMALLRRSLKRNPLDYQARYYLAKAYLRFSAVDNDYFDLGVRELKRAAAIRGSNKQIALDCSARSFSRSGRCWKTADQEFAANLLTAAMPAFSWSEFSPLVEMWSLYVQDTPLLMDLLRLKPEFFGLAANQLVAGRHPHRAAPRDCSPCYEVHTLDALERRYNELTLSGTIDARGCPVAAGPVARPERVSSPPARKRLLLGKGGQAAARPAAAGHFRAAERSPGPGRSRDAAPAQGVYRVLYRRTSRAERTR